MILNPTYVYYSDGDGNPYEGRVKAVGYEFDQLVIWTDNFDFPTEICEKEFSFTLRSHEWLIGILENICDVLTIDINKL